MVVKIKTLALSNIRKQRNFVMELGGADATIYGANAVGKSTTADAWQWLLNGKVADGRSEAEIKTLLDDGTPIHNLDHAVTADLVADGVPLRLRRSMKEKWTKKRGSLVAEFSGHEFSYEIDDVPVSKAQFEAKVATLCPSSLIPALVQPTYVAAQMPWQARRSLFLELAGDLTPDQVFDADPELAPLQASLNGKTVEDYAAMCKAQQKKINVQLTTLPARIDENYRQSAAVDAAPNLEEELAAASAELQAAQEAEAMAAVSGTAQVQGEINEVDGKIATRVAEIKAKLEAATGAARKATQEATAKVAALEAQVRTDARETSDLAQRVKSAADAITRKQAEFVSESARMPDLATIADTCAACGQSLPADKVSAAREAVIEQFNAKKAQTLAQVLADQGTLQHSHKNYTDALAAHQEMAAKRVAELEQAKAEAVRLAAEVEAAEVESAKTRASSDPVLEALQQRRNELAQTLATNKSIGAQALIAARAVTRQKQEQMEGLLKRRAQREAAQVAVVRARELEAEQKALVQEYERLQGMVALCERFTVATCDALEARINKLFTHARVTLFERQINGGIAECCVVTYQGVPYPDLNNASRVNVGLDIIRTVGAKTGNRLPIFVDCRESVSRLINMDPCQIISLVVSPDDKTLRVVTTEPASVAASA